MSQAMTHYINLIHNHDRHSGFIEMVELPFVPTVGQTFLLHKSYWKIVDVELQINSNRSDLVGVQCYVEPIDTRPERVGMMGRTAETLLHEALAIICSEQDLQPGGYVVSGELVVKPSHRPLLLNLKIEAGVKPSAFIRHGDCDNG